MKKVLDTFLLVSSVIMILLFLAALIGSIKFFAVNYPFGRTITDQLFYIGVGAAVFTVLAQWIEGRLKSINNLTKGGEHGRRKRREEEGQT